jgi:hypothetical protein
LLCISGGGGCSDSVSDVVFVVDSSGSICNNEAVTTCANWQAMLNFIEMIVSRLTIGPNNIRVGFVRYANKAENMFFLKDFNDQASLIARIRTIPYIQQESTNTSGGLYIARTQQFTVANGDRASASNQIIVITDGLSLVDYERTIPEAVACRTAGISIIAVGVTPPSGLTAAEREQKNTELRLMSSVPQQLNQNYFTDIDFNNLNTITDQLIQTTCAGLGKAFTILYTSNLSLH